METTEGKIRKQPKYWAITAAAIMLTAFVLVQPMQNSQADVVSTVNPDEIYKCKVRVKDFRYGDSGGITPGIRVDSGRDLEDGIVMNTVKANGIAKTIHAEKQIYDCEIRQGNIPVIVDVTIIGEIFEDLNTKKILEQHAEVITCIKTEFNGELVNCYTTIPEGSVVLSGCVEQDLRHPMEMNTVNKGATVKTVKAEKEIFLCDLDPTTQVNDGPSKKVDLVIFVDIWENATTQEVTKREVFSFKCVAIIEFADVEACDFSTSDDITTPVEPA